MYANIKYECNYRFGTSTFQSRLVVALYYTWSV